MLLYTLPHRFMAAIPPPFPWLAEPLRCDPAGGERRDEEESKHDDDVADSDFIPGLLSRMISGLPEVDSGQGTPTTTSPLASPGRAGVSERGNKSTPPSSKRSVPPPTRTTASPHRENGKDASSSPNDTSYDRASNLRARLNKIQEEAERKRNEQMRRLNAANKRLEAERRRKAEERRILMRPALWPLRVMSKELWPIAPLLSVTE